jgi:hypothetical protein
MEILAFVFSLVALGLAAAAFGVVFALYARQE